MRTTTTGVALRAGGGLTVVLLMAGCGSASGETATTSEAVAGVEATPASTMGEPVGPSPASDVAEEDDPFGFGDDANTAVVTVGEERYEFSDLYCVTIGGALGAQSVGGDPRVAIDLPPEDWETDSRSDWSPPAVKVNLDDGTAWIADPRSTALHGIAEHPGLTGVESFETDGQHASGSATFMEAGAWQESRIDDNEELPEPVSGTFEVTCASD